MRKGYNKPFWNDNKVLVMMTEMINEFNNPNPYQKTIMNSFILTFISYLIKNYSQQAENSKKELFHVRQKEYKYIEEALNYIRLHFSETITLDDLCATSGLSRSYLTKLFKRYTGYSPLDYINNIRCGYAKQMILNGSTVTQAAFSSGFNSTSYFTLCFKKHKGCLPSEIVKQN